MDIRSSWWEKTSCGTAILDELSETLANEENVAIISSKKLPWPETFHNKLKMNIGSSCATRSFEFIGCDYKSSPGETLLEKFCSQEIQAGFWPTSSPSEYLAKTEDTIMNHRYIVVSGISDENVLYEWASFVGEYADACNKLSDISSRAVFILECEGLSAENVSKNITVIQYNQTELDLYMYNIFNTSDFRLPYQISKYAAELVTALADNDAELCGIILQNGVELLKDPFNSLNNIFYSPFNYNFHERKYVESKVLVAQLKAVFPIIYQQKRKYIEKYYDKIEPLLPWTNDFNDTKKNPFEMELRDIIFKSYDIGISSLDKERLAFLRDMRNQLAHNHILSYAEILALCE